ncbi:MAG: RICIN domain-containing protein [Bacilli bacterium]|nr:RICIN domain-containing protein [Bacilli bacterium]
MKKYCCYFVFLLFIFIGFGINHVNALPNGTYKITSALGETKVLTSSEENNIQINEYSEKDNQLWEIEAQSDGSYTISSKVDTGKCFDVAGGSINNRTNIQLYNKNSTNAQKWYIRSAGNGYYYIVSKLPGLHVVDVAGGQKEENNNVWLYEANYTKAQQFKFTEKIEGTQTVEDGTYFINTKIKDSLAVSSSSIADGSNVSTGVAVSSPEQAFNIKYLNDGYYQISSYVDDNIVLSVSGNRGANGANVLLSNKTDSDNNKWIIKKNVDGTYAFVSALDYYYMDISGGSKNSGANIWLYEGNGTKAQSFDLVKVDFSKIEDGLYTISSSVNDNMVVAASSEIVNNKTNINLSTKQDSNTQKWFIKNVEDDMYEIKSAIDENYVLTVDGGSILNAANIKLYNSDGTNAQRWRIIKIGNDNYRFVNVTSGKNVDIDGGRIVNGNNIWQFENNNSAAQIFKLSKAELSSYEQLLENDNYIIYSGLNLNKSLNYSDKIFINGVKGSSKEIVSIEYVERGFYVLKNGNKAITNDNGKLIMSDYINSDEQLWFLSKKGDFYTFISKIDGNVLDVTGGSQADNTKLQMYESNGTNAQIFYLEAVIDDVIEEGYYRISFNDLSLGIDTETAYNGSMIKATDLVSDKQVWYVDKNNDGSYTIKYAINPNRVMDVVNGKTSDGTNIQTYSSNSTPAQKWYVIHLKDGKYKFIGSGSHLALTLINNEAKIYSNDKNQIQRFDLNETDAVESYDNSVANGNYIISSIIGSNKVLDVSGAKPRSNTNVQLYSLNNTLAQVWKFKYINDGMYEIRSALNSKLLLTSVNGNVQINKYTGADNQKWYIKMLENNQISLISAENGLFVDVFGGGSNDGTNIDVYPSNDTISQKFILNVYNEKKTYRGFDVSAHQKYINWNTIASSNIHFVLLRIGFGMYQDQKDAYFETNYASAISHDIPVGVYTYSYALSVDDARAEAYVTLQWLNGRELELPVFFDMEDADYYKERHGMPSNSTLTTMCDTFCDIITKNGYQCGIYASKSWFENRLDAQYLASKYQIWVAHWTGPDDYETAAYHQTPYNKTPYNFWQFSSAGQYNGISGNVDLDYGYNIFD